MVNNFRNKPCSFLPYLQLLSEDSGIHSLMSFRAILAVITTVLIMQPRVLLRELVPIKLQKLEYQCLFFRLGEFTITALSDGTVPQDLDQVVTNANSAETATSIATFANPVEASINAFRSIPRSAGVGRYWGRTIVRWARRQAANVVKGSGLCTR